MKSLTCYPSQWFIANQSSLNLFIQVIDVYAKSGTFSESAIELLLLGGDPHTLNLMTQSSYQVDWSLKNSLI
ncbi:hypothetical protein [Undibacterium sp.]|uniref:hypothetical protein n=1 Tax=Undibacterium sp. TaxID=1914977 RepID=UPI0025F81AAB|nr:hypothetical protein [Undibacterium sp.]